MNIKLALLVLLILQISCKNDAENQTEILNIKTEKVISQKNKTEIFNFENFKISKGKIGDIKVGMNINAAEKKLNLLTRKEADAYDFGFDGGGKAYIYSLENEPVLAIVPKRDSEEILVIIAINKNLKTSNGLNPQSKVKEIQQKYPNIKINQDLMMNWEDMYDENNDWVFVFMTDENNRIGEYNEIEMPTEPKRTETKMNWITIR